jgi:hypothetical protein
MTHTAQVGESSAQRPSLVFDISSPTVDHSSGLLGNRRAQWVASKDESYLQFWHVLRQRFDAPPAFKLAILKQRTFTPEGRQERIRRSLAALEAPQPTMLTREQWKEIVEEIEDEDED